MANSLAKSLIAVACGLMGAACAQAASIDVYTPPATNAAMLALSSNGAYGVTNLGGADYLLNSSTGVLTQLTGGIGQSAGISANGNLIASGAATGVMGTCKVSGVTYTDTCAQRQASVYNTSTGTWTALGSLGYQSATGVAAGTGVAVDMSYSTGMSANGQYVSGYAWAKSTPTGTAVSTHPVVYRDGQVFDLNASATTAQSGKALAVSGNGSVAVGYKTNSSIGSVWTWNGSGYVESAAPTMAHQVTGVQTAISLQTLSSSGVWAAGGSVNLLAVNYGPTGISAPYTVTYNQATLWNTQTNTGLMIPFDHVIDTTNSSSNADIDRNAKATVTGVSDAGVVIGMFNVITTGGNAGLLTYDTWIYNARGDGTSQTFDSYLSDLGLGLTSTQHVNLLFSISADGSAIAGQYFDSAAQLTSSFVLHVPSAVPEPGTWALFSLALPFLAARRLRNSRKNS